MKQVRNKADSVQSDGSSHKLSAAKLVGVAALTLLVLSGAIFFLNRCGYSVARSKGSSMEPYLKEGDALVMRKVKPESVKVGDVVLINRSGAPILHRVVQIYSTPEGVFRVVTQGDNAPANEPPVGF